MLLMGSHRCALLAACADSLGGNAKTLMFVNVSPTDANLDETQSSLQVGADLTA